MYIQIFREISHKHKTNWGDSNQWSQTRIIIWNFGTKLINIKLFKIKMDYAQLLTLSLIYVGLCDTR